MLQNDHRAPWLVWVLAVAVAGKGFYDHGALVITMPSAVLLVWFAIWYRRWMARAAQSAELPEVVEVGK